FRRDRRTPASATDREGRLLPAGPCLSGAAGGRAFRGAQRARRAPHGVAGALSYAAHLLDRRDARRLRLPDLVCHEDARRGVCSRDGDPAERDGALARDAVLVPRDDEALAVRGPYRRQAREAAGETRAGEVPIRLPLREDAR